MQVEMEFLFKLKLGETRNEKILEVKQKTS